MAGPEARVGIFDQHYPPSEDRISDCVHCGFCLPTCPTYVLWNQEMDSPRGRIYLMKMGREGAATWDPKYVGHFDQCLGCMACVTACPSGVKYNELIEATRAQVERNYPRSLSDRLFRWLIFALFPHPLRLRMMLPFLWIYQHLGVRHMMRRFGLLELLPERLRAMEALLPEVTLSSTRSLPMVIAPKGPRRMRVGLMLGCVQRVFFDEVNAATARVLAAEGCEVVIPRDQDCCGALMTHAGRERQAIKAAHRLIDSFERAHVDAVITNAAGCGSNVKEYGFLLRDDPKYAQRAIAFAAKCKDISEVLAELGPRAPRHPVPLRVAYHDACHLQHAQAIRTAPRQMLRSIPELQLLEIDEPAVCCGSAGIYNLVEPEPASQLGERKTQNVLATGADLVVAGNPGCLLQMKSSMKSLGNSLPVLHTIQVLDASIRGVQPIPMTSPEVELERRAA
jgi:glycolate oxidase iron-sulfur subunit